MYLYKKYYKTVKVNDEVYKIKNTIEKSVTELLPHQVELIWNHRNDGPYRFIISNAL